MATPPNDSGCGCCGCGGNAVIAGPTVSITCVSQTASGALCGFSGYNDGSYDPSHPGSWAGQYRKWRYRTISGEVTTGGCSSGCAESYRYTIDDTSEKTCAAATGATLVTTPVTEAGDGSCVYGTPSSSSVMEFPVESYPVSCEDHPGLATYSATLTVKTITQCENACGPEFPNNGSFGEVTETLSGEVSLADAIAASSPAVGSSCIAYGGSMDWTSPESTDGVFFADATLVTATILVTGGAPLSTVTVTITYDNSTGADTYEEVSVSLDENGEAEFELEVPMPAPGESCRIRSALVRSYAYYFAVPASKCYRASWVERVVAGDGSAIVSTDVVWPGVYRPAITWSGGGGSGLELIAVMAPDGSVSAVNVLNPGSGFTSAPTISIEAAVNGGGTSTGWVATLAGGAVVSVARVGGSAGNYLPTGTVTTSTGASVSVVMDPRGGVSVSASGTALSPGSALVLTAKVGGAVAAVTRLHFGTEVARCYNWDGVVPEDYDPLDPETWPYAGPFTLAPGAEIAGFTEYCDCSPCP